MTTQDKMAQALRIKFENWALDQSNITSEENCLARDRIDGRYVYRHVETAWRAYLATREAQAQAVPAEFVREFQIEAAWKRGYVVGRSTAGDALSEEEAWGMWSASVVHDVEALAAPQPEAVRAGRVTDEMHRAAMVYLAKQRCPVPSATVQGALQAALAAQQAEPPFNPDWLTFEDGRAAGRLEALEPAATVREDSGRKWGELTQDLPPGTVLYAAREDGKQ